MILEYCWGFAAEVPTSPVPLKVGSSPVQSESLLVEHETFNGTLDFHFWHFTADPVRPGHARPRQAWASESNTMIPSGHWKVCQAIVILSMAHPTFTLGTSRQKSISLTQIAGTFNYPTFKGRGGG